MLCEPDVSFNNNVRCCSKELIPISAIEPVDVHCHETLEPSITNRNKCMYIYCDGRLLETAAAITSVSDWSNTRQLERGVINQSLARFRRR